MRTGPCIRGPLAAVACTLLACGGSAPPPVVGDLSRADAFVVERVERTLAEVERRPADVGLRGRLALVYHANQLTHLARPAYEQALALDPDQPRLWYQLAVLEAEDGDTPSALATMDRLLARDESYPPAHWRRGFWLLELGRLDEAESAFRHARSLSDADPAAEVGLARASLQRGDYAAAAALLEGLIARYPDLPHLHHLLGTAYRQLGRHDEAAAALARGGEAPDWPDPWIRERQQYAVSYTVVFRRASALVDRGETDEALKLLEGLRRGRPDDDRLLAKIAQVHLARGQLADADEALDAALAIAPESFAANLYAAQLQRKRGLPRPALEHAERAIAANPAVATAHLEKARILFDGGDWAGAEAALQDAIAVGAPDVSVLVILAETQFRQARWQAALDTLGQVTAREPDHVQATVMTGWAQLETGDLAAAGRTLDRAAALAPDHPLVRQAVERLRRARGES